MMLLNIQYKEKVANENIRRKIQTSKNTVVKKRKLRCVCLSQGHWLSKDDFKGHSEKT